MKAKEKCVLLGAGGHARTVLDAVLLANSFEMIGAIDRDPLLKGSKILDIEILGGNECFSQLITSGVKKAIIGIGGTADNSLRQKVFLEAEHAGFEIAGVVHPSAIVSPFAAVNHSAQILAGAIVGPLALIGCGAIINTRVAVEHDCNVGAFSHLATGAILGGNVVIGDLAHVGSGAVILQSVRIGRSAVVGSGAVVLHDVEDSTVVAGVPARSLYPANRC